MFGLIESARISLPEEWIEKIDKIKKNDEDLVNVWKKSFSKAKSFKKSNSDFTLYMSLADYIYKIHLDNLKEIKFQKETKKLIQQLEKNNFSLIQKENQFFYQKNFIMNENELTLEVSKENRNANIFNKNEIIEKNKSIFSKTINKYFEILKIKDIPIYFEN